MKYLKLYEEIDIDMDCKIEYIFLIYKTWKNLNIYIKQT